MKSDKTTIYTELFAREPDKALENNLLGQRSTNTELFAREPDKALEDSLSRQRSTHTESFARQLDMQSTNQERLLEQ